MKNLLSVEGNIYSAGIYGMKIRGAKDYLYIGSGIEINDCMSRHLHNLKRNLYADTNKRVLQYYYYLGLLVFEVIKEVESKDVVKNMSVKEKESLQESLGVLEQFNIRLYKDSVCNSHMSVTKHSSNRDKNTSIKRHEANEGSKNPNCKNDEKIIQEMLWLKLNGYKPKQIIEFYTDTDIKSSYISRIGVDRWVHLEPIKPTFING